MCIDRLKCAVFNVNSLANKINYVTSLLVDNAIDIIGLTETWLLPSVPDSFVSICGYGIVRVDTLGTFPKHGVGYFIKNCLVFESVECPIPNVSIVFLVKYGLHVVLVYRPPSNSYEADRRLLQFLLDFCVGKEMVIFGDFNLSDIDWRNEGCLFLTYSARVQAFVDVFISLGLTQWVCTPTFVRSGNILDLVFTTDPDRVACVEVLPPFLSLGHSCVMFDYLFQMDVESAFQAQRKRAWFRGRFGAIEEHLRACDWYYEFYGLSVSGMFGRLKDILSPLISSYVPLFSDRVAPNRHLPPPWMKRDRSRAWKFYKDTRNTYGRHSAIAVQALAVFDVINSRYRNFFSDSQMRYEQSLLENFRECPKRFHTYIRSKKVGGLSVGPLKRVDGSLVVDCDEMAEMFVEEFSSVFISVEPRSPAPHQTFDGVLDTVPLSLTDVAKRLSLLDVNTSVGPDGIHPLLLRSCPSLAAPLYMIFCKSLSNGVLPTDWKRSTVVPLFKKGSRTVALNYRPISLTSVCVKTLERIVVDCLYDYLEEHHLLSGDQFGFRRSMSVDDQLLLVYNDITSWLDSGHAADVVLFDFSKAFDKVSHSVLLRKLRLLGVTGSLLDWIGSFLVGRSMSVSVLGMFSTSRPVLSGVPQGSVLGPLLFLIYANFLPTSIRNQCKFFADDLKIYLKVQHRNCVDMALDLEQCQHDINSVVATAASWGLVMNADKCAVLRFGARSDWTDEVPHGRYVLNGEPLSVVTSHRDLGILVDSNLRFHEHIRSLVNKAAGLSVNLLRSTLCRAAVFMVPLFVSHIRPLLDFASPVWNTGFIGDLRLLESVQRRWTKCIDGLQELPYSERLRLLDLYSVQGRLLRADMLKCWKIFHGKCGVAPGDLFVMAPNVGTRGHRYKLAHVYSSLECRRRFFALRCISTWNALPEELVSAQSVATFKSGLHTALGCRLFEFVD